MENKEFSYTEALGELEAILTAIESGKEDIDTLASKVTRATELIKLCRTHIVKVEGEVNEILKVES